MTPADDAGKPFNFLIRHSKFVISSGGTAPASLPKQKNPPDSHPDDLPHPPEDAERHPLGQGEAESRKHDAGRSLLRPEPKRHEERRRPRDGRKGLDAQGLIQPRRDTHHRQDQPCLQSLREPSGQMI